MNIAFIYPHWNINLPPDNISDALAVIAYELTTRIANYCSVTIYPRKKAFKPKSEFHEGVHYRRVSMGFDRLLSASKLLDKFGLRSPNRPFHSSALYFPNYAFQVAKDLRKRKCDIAHIFTIPQYAETIKKLNPDIKVILHMQDHSLTQRDHALLEKQLQKVDVIIGCSQFITQNIKDAFPLYSDKCYTIYNGVNIDRFVSKQDGKLRDLSKTRNILYVGRISPEKGIHILIDAFKTILADHPHTTLNIVGPNSLAPKQFIDPLKQDSLLENLQAFYSSSKKYEQYLKKIALPDKMSNISFHGVIPNFKLFDFYHEADVFVFPSVWHEPFGIPLVEAMAAGIPVVATRGGAFSEIVNDGKAGILVNRGDENSLAKAINLLLSDNDLRLSMGKEARKRAMELFSWDIIVKNLVDLYDDVSCGRSKKFKK
jgi:glycosyltransferase involved in cell wall biosynthesis